MNKDIFKGKWNQVKGEVKKQWGDLTDDELDRIEGSYDKMVGKLQERYGYNKQKAALEADKVFGAFR
jgi:uncharacterized protein YjbJ (UPF0337 family)